MSTCTVFSVISSDSTCPSQSSEYRGERMILQPIYPVYVMCSPRVRGEEDRKIFRVYCHRNTFLPIYWIQNDGRRAFFMCGHDSYVRRVYRERSVGSLPVTFWDRHKGIYRSQFWVILSWMTNRTGPSPFSFGPFRIIDII